MAEHRTNPDPDAIDQLFWNYTAIELATALRQLLQSVPTDCDDNKLIEHLRVWIKAERAVLQRLAKAETQG